jgi:4'-phosphopantetheinyl transferase EntD
MRTQALNHAAVDGARRCPQKFLQTLLPADVAVIGVTGDARYPDRLPVASQLVAKSSDHRRRNDHAAGRHCAGTALRRLGRQGEWLGSHRDGRPKWPPGVTGSITHTEGFAAAAVGEQQKFRAIGIDAEKIGGVTKDLWHRIFSTPETQWLEGLHGAEQAKAATSMFSAKEAFYKCQYELTGQWLEFRDIVLRLFCGHPGRGRFIAQPVGRLALFEQHPGPALIRFATLPGLALSAMTIAV